MSDYHHPRSILVITVVHDPRDSRIWFRQIDALLQRGWLVTYAAPFSADRPLATTHISSKTLERLRLVPLPRARGKARLRAAISARGLLRQQAAQHDVVLIHDPELLVAAFGLRVPHLIWDVHEDTAGALAEKPWVPAILRAPARRVVHYMEQWADERFTLLLAEASYQERFRKPHALVPNAVIVPDEVTAVLENRVVYLGSLTPARGSDELPAIGRLLKRRSRGAITLEVIGPTYDDMTTKLMLDAHLNRDLIWRGFLPAREALDRIRGALAGLSLLSDTPNFRASMPTKLLEYSAYGVPVISTPLPQAVRLIERSGSGVVVPWDSPQAVADAVMEFAKDKRMAQEMGRRGHQVVAAEYNWAHWSEVFAAELESVAQSAGVPIGREQA